MQFQLRPWRIEDAQELAQCANNPHIAMMLRDVFPFPYTVQDAEEYIRSCIEAEKKQLCRAIEIDGQVAGSIGVFPEGDVYRKSAELGYWLAEPYWGQGVMTEATKELCAQAFERFDIVRIFAEPFAHNLGSRRVLEKAGFAVEGIKRQSIYKSGALQDSYLYALLSREM